MTKQKCKNKMAAIIKKHAKEDTAKSHLKNKMAAKKWKKKRTRTNWPDKNAVMTGSERSIDM